MMHLNWSRFFTGILFFMSLTACGGSGGSSDSSSQTSFSNATLAGNWIITEESRSFFMSANEIGEIATYGDITELSRIDITSAWGPYKVESDGSFSFFVIDAITGVGTGGTGKLLSSTSGTITLAPLNIPSTMSKVTNLAICQGHYSGTISNRGITSNISFDVDMSGTMGNFLSDVSYFTDGKAYAVGSNAVMLMKTYGLNEITAWGILENGHFTGSFQSDSDAIGTISLVKS